MLQSLVTFFGVDVAKDTVVVHEHGQRQTLSIANKKRELCRWLDSLPSGSAVAAESTGRYHQLLISQACDRDLAVYLLNPRDVKHYGLALGRRAKTDPLDAQLISRYLAQEHSQLHRYQRPTATQARLTELLQRRHAVVQLLTGLQQSFEGERFSQLKTSQQALSALIDQIDDTMVEAVKAEPQLAPLRERLWGIVGFGPILSVAMANLLSRFAFASSDALIAYIGFDPRARESGAWRGRRKLSKRGPAEIRRLLYMGAMSAAQTSRWKEVYQKYRARGLPSTAAYVVLARKLARIAYSMAKFGTTFDQKLEASPCANP